MEAPPRFELGSKGFADLRLTTWLWRRNGAVDETRTRDLNLGKVALYQLSYYRALWCLGPESNQRHADFQSAALPTELPRQVATRKGLEPSTSSVTGWHSNQLNYRATCGGNNRARTCDPLLVRQMLSQLSYVPLRSLETLDHLSLPPKLCQACRQIFGNPV